MKTKTMNPPLAFHLCGVESRPLGPVRGRGVRLPPRLVLEPGRYTVHGKTYDLRREGLYRFLLPGADNQQRIVFRRDPLALLSAVAWITSHGSRDNARTTEECLAIARRGKLIITCGRVAKFAVHLLAERGVPARVVQVMTLDAPNTYDTGHVLLEAWLDGRWTLVDPDVKVLFRRRGRRLSLLEFSEASQTGDYAFERLSAATAIAVGCFEENGYDYGLFMETAFCNETCLRRWYRHIMQVPIIRRDDRWFITGRAGDMRKAVRRRQLPWTVLPRARFVREFYQPPQEVE